MGLRELYLAALDRCSPERLVQERVDPSMPRDVVAIGKCAGALLDGVAATHPVRDAFAAIPAGYVAPKTPAAVHFGGHPQMTAASFAAGRALLAWIDAHEDILFLISGGGSACVEVARSPHTEEEVARRNAALIREQLPIAAINAARREVSAIKGGRLRDRVGGRCITMVWSDVSEGALADVASGPTITRSDEAILIADNRTLTMTAAGVAGDAAVAVPSQLEGDVHAAAVELLDRACRLDRGQVLIAGGEPLVSVRGQGHGGRCTELALRFWLEWTERGTLPPMRALFASSDGVDGNSGVAGIELELPGPTLDRAALLRSLEASDSATFAVRVGRAIIIPPTGNNLRDIFLVARD